MSTYAISDLHGYPLEKLKALLDRVGFSDEDTLYVIGDVIDRNGDGGVELLRWIMAQPNVEFILGNHEDMLLNCAFLFEEITDESIAGLSPESLKHYDRWMRNGGGVTLDSLRKLLREEPEVNGSSFGDALSADSSRPARQYAPSWAVRNPPLTEKPKNMVDTQTASVAQHGAHKLGERLVCLST